MKLVQFLFFLWRWLLTGLCFAFFFALCWVYTWLAFPLLRLRNRRDEAYRRRVRGMIRAAFRLLLAIFRIGGLLRLDLPERPRMEALRGCVVVANHPTLIDVLVLYSILESAECIIKPALLGHPFIGGVVREAGFIAADDASAVAAEASRSLAAGSPLIIFPEGTRSPPGGLGRFRRGGAALAIRQACQMIPIVIKCDPPALYKGQAWHQIPPRRIHLHLSLHPPLYSPDGPPADAESQIREISRLTKKLKTFYHEALHIHAQSRNQDDDHRDSPPGGSDAG